MKYAQLAMDQMLAYYIGIIIMIFAGAVLSFVGKKSAKTYPFGIALCLILVWQINLFVPFIRDYARNEIVVQECEYENSSTGRKNTHSRLIGLKSVTLNIGDEEIMLTTVPGHKDIFIEGKYYVQAYYLPESMILLHIEILEPQA